MYSTFLIKDLLLTTNSLKRECCGRKQRYPFWEPLSPKKWLQILMSVLCCCWPKASTKPDSEPNLYKTCILDRNKRSFILINLKINPNLGQNSQIYSYTMLIFKIRALGTLKRTNQSRFGCKLPPDQTKTIKYMTCIENNK